jgi:hypothetical protein
MPGNLIHPGKIFLTCLARAIFKPLKTNEVAFGIEDAMEKESVPELKMRAAR